MRFQKLSFIAVLILSSFHSFSQSKKKVDNLSISNDTTDIVYKLTHRPDALYFTDKNDLLNQLQELDFVNAMIYFSGTGFARTEAAAINGKLIGIKQLFDRCGSGSRITFEKCILRLADNKKSQPITKSLFIK